MAKRHVAHHEAWSEHTKKLPPLQVGMKVFVQNQVGHHPRRWDKTGVVMECDKFDQYVVKMDGTGRLTRRNRKFLRRLTPLPKHPLPQVEVSSQPPLPTALAQAPAVSPVPPVVPQATLQREDVVEIPQMPQPHYTPPREHQPNYTLPREDEITHPLPDHNTPQEPQSHCTPHRDEEVAIPPGPLPGAELGARPQRARKPNVRYNSDEWDLGPVTYAHPDPSHDLIRDMVYFLATKLGYHRSQP